MKINQIANRPDQQSEASKIANAALNGQIDFRPIGSDDGDINHMESETGGQMILHADNDNECSVYLRPDGSEVIVFNANGPCAVDN